MLAAAGRRHVLRWFSRDVMLQQTEEALLSLTSAQRPEEVI
jgi:hypothetical protein